jgi:hypothetical protein
MRIKKQFRIVTQQQGKVCERLLINNENLTNLT